MWQVLKSYKKKKYQRILSRLINILILGQVSSTPSFDMSGNTLTLIIDEMKPRRRSTMYILKRVGNAQLTCHDPRLPCLC